MNCWKARRRAAMSAPGAVPESAAQHLETCGACRQWLAADARVSALLRWKRHEQPDPFLAARLSARVRAAIVEMESRRGFRWGRVFPTLSLPVARYGLAAVFIGMVTFQFLAEPQRSARRPAADAPAPFTLGGIGPAAPLPVRRWDDHRSMAHADRPPWLQYAPVSATNLASAGIQPGFGFRRFDDE